MPIVTASFAIIKQEGNKKAPAGVVGVQISHEKFTSAFMDVTNEYKVKINYYSEILHNVLTRTIRVKLFVMFRPLPPHRRMLDILFTMTV